METPTMVVFVVKQYAVRKAKNGGTQYARPRKGGTQYAGGGGGVTLHYVVSFDLWQYKVEVKEKNRNNNKGHTLKH